MSLLATLGVVKNAFIPKHKNVDIATSSLELGKFVGFLLLGCSILTTSKQFFGEPILCKPAGALPVNLFNTYCFTAGTETFQANTRVESLPDTHSHHGISVLKKDGQYVLHNYYQWVPFVLLFQALLFFLPGKLWKKLDGGKVEKLLSKIVRDPLTETSLEAQVEGISSFLANHPAWYSSFARNLFFCHVGIFLSAVFQMYLLDRVFDQQFFSLGTDFFLATEGWEHHRIVEDVFPLVTFCRMKYTAPTGGVQEDSGLCTLSVNILNQKIFVVIWFILLAIILYTALVVIYELLIICIPGLRYLIIRSQAKTLSSSVLCRINKFANFGTYTLLMLIAKNLDGAQFETMLTKLSDKIGMMDFYPNSINIPPSSSKSLIEDFPLKTKQADSPLMMRPRLMSG